MRIKIYHPVDWAAKTMLRRGLMTGGVILAFVYFAPLKEIFCSGGGKICLALLPWAVFLAYAAGLFLIIAPIYILYKERRRRAQKGPQITAVEFASSGVTLQHPPMPPLFLPYEKTVFELLVQAAVKETKYTRSYIAAAVQMTFTQGETSFTVQHRINQAQKHLLPLLDLRKKFASFSLKVEPLTAQKQKKRANRLTIKEKTELKQIYQKAGLKAKEIEKLLDKEPTEVRAVRLQLNDYMKYGIWRSMSSDMRQTFLIFGLMFIGAAGYFYVKFFGFSAPDLTGGLIVLLPALGGASLLYAAGKDRRKEKTLERLRGKNSPKN